LTGQLSPGDDASLQASGMDGTLGKPVSLAEMLHVLLTKVWSCQSQVPPAADRSEADPGDEAKSLSVERIEELRTSLPPERLAELIEECLTDLDHRIPALRRSLHAGATSSVLAHAHTMSGVAAAYGLAALEAELRTIMLAARDNRLATLTGEAIVKVEAEFVQASRLLRNVIRVPEGQSAH
jgi:HPt (histidine-containing phosphotransfer) domain-containing protein